ncbi:MAG: XdhC family protein [Sarcina sp.]
MEHKILQEIEDRVLKGETCALVTVTESKGSTPRKIGSLMAVFNDSISGTIGGGIVEYNVINEARNLFITGMDKAFEYGMAPTDPLKLACGGSVKGFIKVFKPSNKLVIIGAGHVSRELTYIAKRLDFDIVVIDDREDYKEVNGIEVLTGDVVSHIRSLNLPYNTYVIIASRGHSVDKVALKEFIELDLKYIGMIGSRAKVTQVTKELLAEGIDIKFFEKLYAPIGLDFSDGTPAEIAIEILAEILKIKNEGTGNHRRMNIKEKVYPLIK